MLEIAVCDDDIAVLECAVTVSYTHLKYFVECCGCDYRKGKTKGVNRVLGVENSVKSGRESDLSGLRKRYLGNFSI